ncbi:MAG: hypothetical protein WC346_18005 [Methanogenium sp.]
MMIADIFIEFVYFFLRILYNVVKYSVVGITKLVKYVKYKYIKYKSRKRAGKFNLTDLEIIKDEDGKYIIEFKGGIKK